MSDPSKNNTYWRTNIRLVVSLLIVWLAVGFGCGIFFIEPLNAIRVGNVGLGFWFAQQGAIFVFVILVLVYALAMDRVDRRLGAREQKDEAD